MSGHPKFKAILDERWELHCEKALAYGSSKDPLANLRSGEKYGVPAWKRCLAEAESAFSRLENICNGRNSANDAAENALMDASSWCDLALLFVREGNERAAAILGVRTMKAAEDISAGDAVVIDDSKQNPSGDYPPFSDMVKRIRKDTKEWRMYNESSQRTVTNPEWLDDVAERMQQTMANAK